MLCFCPVVNPSSAVLFLFTPHRCFALLLTSVSVYSSQVFLFSVYRCFCLLLTGVSVYSSQVFLFTIYMCFCLLLTGVSVYSSQVFLFTIYKCFCLLLTSVAVYSSQVFLFIPHMCWCLLLRSVVFHSHTARCFVTTRPCFVSVFCQSQDLVSVCSHLRAFCSTSHTQRLVALLMLAIHLQLSLVLFCYLQYFYTQPKVFCVFTTRCLFVFFTDSPKLCLSLPPLIAKRFNESCSGVSKYRSWNDPRAGFPVFVDFIFFSVFDVNFQICSPVSSSY